MSSGPHAAVQPEYVASAPYPTECIAFAVRAAAEGVPVGVIARAIGQPYDRVLAYLQRAKALGAITDIPRADWPNDHMPRERPKTPMPVEEVEFLCRRTFHLTNLEAGFLVVLLRCLFAEKEKLHAVIELQRNTRHLRPDKQEITDPKMVDVMICKLRKKLAACNPDLTVSTSWGKGYFLEPQVKDLLHRLIDRPVRAARAATSRALTRPRVTATVTA